MTMTNNSQTTNNSDIAYRWTTTSNTGVSSTIWSTIWNTTWITTSASYSFNWNPSYVYTTTSDYSFNLNRDIEHIYNIKESFTDNLCGDIVNAIRDKILSMYIESNCICPEQFLIDKEMSIIESIMNIISQNYDRLSSHYAYVDDMNYKRYFDCLMNFFIDDDKLIDDMIEIKEAINDRH